MSHKILADIIVVIHFAWIIFMLFGFVLTVWGLIRWKGFFDKWIFRTAHLLGIVYVVVLVVMQKHCPLTVLEYNLRTRYDPASVFAGSFIVNYIEKLVYPNINPLIIIISTIFIGVFTVVVYIIKPPGKIKKFIKCLGKGKGDIPACPPREGRT